MSLQTIVQVLITRATAALTRVGFGTPLLLVTHDVIPDLAKSYGGLDEMEDDGFTSADLAHKMATALLGQNPKVSSFILGKRTRQPTRLVRLTPVATPAASALHLVTIDSDDGTTLFEFTTDATPTVAEITAGINAAIEQTAWVTTTAYVVGDYVRNSGNVYKCVVAGTSGATGPVGTGPGEVDGTVTWDFKGPVQNINPTDDGPGTSILIQSADAPDGTPTASVPFGVEYDRTQFDSKDETTDPGIADDLSDVRDVNDDWYAITGDWWDEATADALAAVIETLQRAHIWSNGDTDVLDAADTTDAFSVMNGKAYERSGGIWHSNPHSHPAAAWIGRMLPFDPGDATWKFKTLGGISFDEFTSGELAALVAKKANHYIRVAGLNITAEGVMHQGEFIDTIRGLDFVAQRIAEDVFAHLQANPKIPYTDAGAASIQGVVDGRLQSATKPGGGSGQIFTDDPAPVVTVPLVADIDASTRASRLLPDVDFTATLAGAVHNVQVNGTVAV
jgi:hypothetical protein